jgi:3'-5' exoribonuclease
MERATIKDLKTDAFMGREVIDTYAVRKIELKTVAADGKSGAAGKQYLSLELGDATGRIDGVMWDNVDAVSKEVAAGDVVKLKGVVGKYRDNPQVKVDLMARLAPADYKLEHFLAASGVPKPDLEAGIRMEMASVAAPPLMKLLKAFFDDPEFMRSFLDAPAAKLWHHAWLGGLAEHTLAVCRLARGAQKNYDLLDADLLITGCLLHDIGKIREFKLSTFIDYSDEGRLVGHLVLGDQMLMEKVNKIRDFPDELAKRLRHIVLAHHGEKERGSPVVPATLEALIVHHCDYMDAHAAAFTRIIKREGLQNKRWSDYVNLIDRYIYLANMDDDRKVENDGNLKLF